MNSQRFMVSAESEFPLSDKIKYIESFTTEHLLGVIREFENGVMYPPEVIRRVIARLADSNIICIW